MEDSGTNKAAYKATEERDDAFHGTGVNDSRLSDASRKAVLKVEFYGPNTKATVAAKSYLEQVASGTCMLQYPYLSIYLSIPLSLSLSLF